MKVRYNRKEDILVLEASKASIDHAEESGPIIAHFSANPKVLNGLNEANCLNVWNLLK
jgi:hypothetical protein